MVGEVNWVLIYSRFPKIFQLDILACCKLFWDQFPAFGDLTAGESAGSTQTEPDTEKLNCFGAERAEPARFCEPNELGL